MKLAGFINNLKPHAVSLLYSLGYFSLQRRLKSERVSILMYHRFSKFPEPFKTPQVFFEKQLKYLQQRYNFISFNDYLQTFHRENVSLPKNPMLLTIDDGFRDNYEYAYPLLQKYDVPATIFLTTDFVSRRAWLW